MASLGMITPSIIIITIIANFLENFAHIGWVQHAFAGIRVGVSALVFFTVIKMVKANANTALKFIIFLLTFIAIAFLSISPIIIVISVGVLGILLGKGKENA